MNAELRPHLDAGLHALGLLLSDAQSTQLLDFLALLQKWNQVYNLTALRKPQDMLTHHLLDSLAAVPSLLRHWHTLPARPQPYQLLDVGSGGGLPGVVFAICCPQLQVRCVDTVAKKAAFLQQAAASLHLPNLQGIHARVETLRQPFDLISCRAFASLPDFVHGSRQALAPEGLWCAMKGQHPSEEIAALPPDVQVLHIEPLRVPGLDAQRCIVWMRKAAPAHNTPAPAA